MIGNPIEKRRAERFSELLEAARQHSREIGPRSHKRSTVDEDLSSMVELGRALDRTAVAAHPDAAPDPGFQADLRQRLLAVAATQGVGVERIDDEEDPAEGRHRPPAGRRRMVVAGILAAGVLGMSGVSTASGDAVPGDTLYPVKRSTERAQLALAGSEVNRAQLYFEFARTRLTEAKQVVDDPAALESALSDMDTQFLEGMKAMTITAAQRSDAHVLDTVDDFLDHQSPGVNHLLSRVPQASKSYVNDSLTLLSSAATRTEELRGAILCKAKSDMDGDELGPLPGDCPAPSSGGAGAAAGGSHASGGTESGRDTPSPAPSGSKATPAPGDTPSDTPGASAPSDTPSSSKGDEGGLLSDIGDTLNKIFGG
ncbi:MAG TPA: DUF5667 domain-containing protein [Stackebrandtia sp.]|uniref:DUF5667 domain-containing protein n=1 Tax=Stackebrandtia sp. TaxID=2023065 RepID=UPI002D47002E|nr:DUF5667 domain-containing protein [Stackebrandtia sp.]HZE37879.1 DUF5667 domain-containing protein [Stackebrandtia sp.]